MAQIWRRRGKLLFIREIGGDPIAPITYEGSFPRAMLKSQALGNKQQLRPTYYQKDIVGHFGCVNAIEFNKDERFLASGGDDKRVLIWNASELFTTTSKPKAEVMKGRHESNVFCLEFTSDTERLLSSGNDHTVLVHNVSTADPLDVYILEEAVYSISVHPDTDRIFVTACEDGRVQLWDQRLPSTTDALVIASHHAAFQSASFNPMEGRLIATANSRDGVQLWDVRRPKWSVMRYNVGAVSAGVVASQRASCMCVRWDSRGERLLALRRRASPVLFHVGDSRPLAYFDHPGYFNSCTMKSCCFAGVDDEFAVSGSDNFNIYMWPTPSGKEGKPVVVKSVAGELKGHRSIVNQVRYSKVHQMLASSGVEKVVKLWSPWGMPGGRGGGQPRPLYTQQEYLHMVVDGGLPPTPHQHAPPDAMDEDPKMLAFFDSLVRREIENESSSEDSSDESFAERTLQFLVGSDDDENMRRRWRRTGQAHAARSQDSGQYSNEVVESESSSSSSSPSDASGDILDYESSGGTSVDGMDASSDPEGDRRRLAIQTSLGKSPDRPNAPREHFDPALGHLPLERDVTGLVMRKRRMVERVNAAKKKWRRTCSDPGVHDPMVQAEQTRAEDLSGDEARRRVEAAMASCRRGRCHVALRRLVRDSSSDSEGALPFRLATSSDTDSDHSVGPSNRKRRACSGQTGGSGDIFRKRARRNEGKETGKRRRHYRGIRRQSGSSSESGELEEGEESE